jgi:DMSO/TMAO reductase YedYZ molybdopterin-dependent catalytic subunit
MDYSIQVTGGSTPVTLSYDDITAMDFVELNGVTSKNALEIVTTYNYVGVPLMTIVNRAEVPSGEHSYKVTAVDGYSLKYSQAQFNVGVVAFKTNGIANTDDINGQTPIFLVIPGENRNAWLKFL